MRYATILYKQVQFPLLKIPIIKIPFGGLDYHSTDTIIMLLLYGNDTCPINFKNKLKIKNILIE